MTIGSQQTPLAESFSCVDNLSKVCSHADQMSSSAALLSLAHLNNLGMASMESGDHSGACHLFLQSLEEANNSIVTFFSEADVRTLAESTFNQRNNNTSTNSYLYQRRDYDEGMSCFQETLAIYPEVSSPQVAQATLLFNLGQLCLRSKSDQQASYCFTRALMSANDSSDGIIGKVSSRCEEVTAQLMISILHNLGQLQYREGRHEDALKTYLRAMSIVKQASGSNPRFLLALAYTMNCLGVLHFHLQNSDGSKALAYFHEALTIYSSLHGQRTASRFAATCLNNLGRVHYLHGSYDEALRLYTEALSVRRHLLGKDNIDTAATAFNAAQTFHQQGQLSEAMDLYEEFLSIVKNTLGKEYHRDVAIAKKCLGQVHHELKNFDQAISLYKEAILIGKAALGTHPEVATILNKLGNALYETGDFETALGIYREGLAVERAALPAGHPNIAVTLTNIGQILKIRGDLAGALKVYKEVIRIHQKKSEYDHPNVAATLSAIALIHYQTHNYTKALEVYQEVLRIRRDAFGDEHLEVASTLNSIGLVLFKMELREFSLQSFHESLRIRYSVLGKHHHSVAIILYNIATIHLEAGDDDEALVYYRETLRVERASLGETHNDVVLTIQQIAQVHQQRGELTEALDFFRSALAVQMKVTTKDHMAIAKSWNLIGNIHLQWGRTAEMVEALTEAVRHLRAAGKSENDLVLSGFNFFGMSKLHPECAPVA